MLCTYYWSYSQAVLFCYLTVPPRVVRRTHLHSTGPAGRSKPEGVWTVPALLAHPHSPSPPRAGRERYFMSLEVYVVGGGINLDRMLTGLRDHQQVRRRQSHNLADPSSIPRLALSACRAVGRECLTKIDFVCERMAILPFQDLILIETKSYQLLHRFNFSSHRRSRNILMAF